MEDVKKKILLDYLSGQMYYDHKFEDLDREGRHCVLEVAEEIIKIFED